jgi:hypothetical protein
MFSLVFSNLFCTVDPSCCPPLGYESRGTGKNSRLVVKVWKKFNQSYRSLGLGLGFADKSYLYSCVKYISVKKKLHKINELTFTKVSVKNLFWKQLVNWIFNKQK